MFFCRFTVNGNFLRKSYQRFFLVGHIFSEGLCVFNELFIMRYTHLKFTSFPVWSLFIGFPHPPLRKSFVCDDSRNIIYAKHNIICRKATSFSDRKRKRYLRLWRKMVFLPAVGNTTLRVVVPLPPREGRRIPKKFRDEGPGPRAEGRGKRRG